MLRRLNHERPEHFAFAAANLGWAKRQIAKLASEDFDRVARLAEIGAERDNRVSVNAVDLTVIAHGGKRNR